MQIRLIAVDVAVEAATAIPSEIDIYRAHTHACIDCFCFADDVRGEKGDSRVPEPLPRYAVWFLRKSVT